MFKKVIKLDVGPATLIPLIHVPLLKKAPRIEGEYKVIPDSLGDLCHFYGDFSGYHIYMIASTYKKNIIESSLDYYDKKNGIFTLSIEVILNTGESRVIQINSCKCPLVQAGRDGIIYPEKITIENFSTGSPDGIKFHFPNEEAKFRFANNLIPDIPEKIRLELPEICDLKIEYIGKSVGKDGTREISDRLGDGHSTESIILNEFLYKKTNLDVYAILYKPGALTIGEDGSLSHELSFSEVVDILEKSLIASFLPEKNKNSRDFPKDVSIPAKKLIKLGVSNLWLTVNSPLEYGLLYSDDVERERVHKFDLEIPNYT